MNIKELIMNHYHWWNTMILIFTETDIWGTPLALKYDKNKLTKLTSEISTALMRLYELSELEKNDFLSDPP